MRQLNDLLNRLVRPTILGVLLVVAACRSAPTPASPTAPTPLGTLAWRDEFDGAAGAPIDASKWSAEIGGQGWGNNERQYYTDRSENVAHDGAGHLVITARAEPQPTTLRCWYGDCRYTSARLITKGKFEQTYGRFEARLKVPRGQGIWPAFWMLGNDIDRVDWPRSGEIDIMENIGREPNVVHGTMHGPGYSGEHGITEADTLAQGTLADDFHVYAVEWQPSEIRWYIDGKLYHRVTPASLPSGAAWVFDHPFFLLLNVAVGGNWPGDPDASSTYPQQMVVDYVRVYR